jgi:nucleoside-diphosphate-sugar epimerase
MTPFGFYRLPTPIKARLRALRADRTLLPRRLLLLAIDALVLALGFWAAFALRLNQLYPPQFLQGLPLLLALLPIGLGTLFFSRWYRSLTRTTGSHSLYGLLPRTALIVLLLLLVTTLQGGPQPPRSFWLLLWGLITTGLILSRILARDLLSLSFKQLLKPQSGIATLVYGAGEAGHRLLQELHQDPRFNLLAVVDDNPALWHRRLHRLTVHDPEALPDLIQRHGLRQVLLAMPTAPRSRRRALASQLRSLGLEVLTIPSLADIASGRQRVSELQTVAIEDLLGREASEPLAGLLNQAVTAKTVLITGAGGSIGSELCRQVLALGARRLLLLDHSEYALYSLHQELHAAHSRLVPVLADAADQPHLEALCRHHGVQVLLHAAAYKHVPLVEANVCAALANNLRSTAAALGAARACGLESFTLISTDKAVRPTNAMGASKRACELLVQNAAAAVAAAGSGPRCSMVRFGNVLGSSGSVVPLFRRQIAAGGPVTVTHPEITRYFMTIPEAVQLVLQASAMARGGEVFVLDMGEPVQITDLARQMIQLSGCTVKDAANPSGEIELKFTGLRPGEKLYEELLISAEDAATAHPLIRQAQESFLATPQLEPLLEQLNGAIAQQNDEAAKAVLAQIVPEYRPRQTVSP